MGHINLPKQRKATLVNLAGVDGTPILRCFQRLGFQGSQVPPGTLAQHFSNHLQDSSLTVFYMDHISGMSETIFGHLLEGSQQPACVCITPELTPPDDLIYLQEKVGFLLALCAPIHDVLLERHLAHVVHESTQIPWNQNKENRFQKMLSEGLFSGAKHALGASLRLTEPSPFLYSRFAELYHHMDKLDKAEAIAIKSLKLDPKHLHSINILAQIRMKLGLMEDALEVFQGVIRSKPQLIKKIKTLNTKAIEARKKGQWQEAVAFYQEAIELWPDSPHRHLLWFNMALAYYGAGQKGLAVEACKRCTECAPFGFTKHSDLWDRIIQQATA